MDLYTLKIYSVCFLCVFVVLSGNPSHASIPDLLAVAGGVAYLPCNVSLPEEASTISLILWYRDVARAPIYTLDFRKESLEKAKHFRSSDIQNRANFNVSIHPPSLILNPVRETDKGLYKCSIEYRRSRTVTSAVTLNIIIPPHTVVVKDDRGQKLMGLAGPYDEGASLSLSCEAYGGDPIPTVTWWRDRVLLDDTNFRKDGGVVTNDIYIDELRRSDLMVELTCQASNTNLTYPINDSVRIDLNLKPTHIAITTQHKSLKISEDIRLDCESSGSRPPARLTWWIDNRKVQNGKESIPESRNITYSSLFIKAKQEDNGRNIVCKAENPALPHSTMDDSWYLNVLYPPEVSLAYGANIKYSKIREGNDVYLECIIKSNPGVSDLTWLFEGQPFFTNASAGIIISNQSLVLQRVKKEHRGRYKCIAANSEGTGQSKYLLLEVRYAPTCKPSKKSVIGVSRGESVNITCEVEADPGEVTFRWALNTTVEYTELQTFTSSSGSSALTFMSKTMQGFGAVLCWGRNSVGEQKEPCVVRVVHAEPPDAVEKCVVANRTVTWIMVICQPGYSGGLEQQFHLEVHSDADDHLQTNLTSFENPTFSVTDLPKNSQFLLVVYASNEKGRSNSIAFVGGTLSDSSNEAESALLATLSPIVVLLLAVLGTLLIVGVVALGFLHLRRRRPRKAAEDEDKTKFNLHRSHDVLKKTAEDMVENACPDVVPPNNIYGSRDSDSLEESVKKAFPSPDNAKAVENLHNCAVALKSQWNMQNQEKAEVEVTLPDLNHPNMTVSRLHSTSPNSAQALQHWPSSDDVTTDITKLPLVVEVQPNGTGHRTKVVQASPF